MSSIENPGVKLPPPILYVGGLVVGWLIDRYVRAVPIPGIDDPWMQRLGIALIVIGVALAAWGMITFRRARTAIIPTHPATQIVSHGPYRFTRNPMYVGMSVTYLGVCLLVDSVWPLLLLPVVLIVLNRFVIRREEAYLASAFGDTYAGYRLRVRRWL